MIDVAVTHPGAPSRKSDRPLAAAGDLEARKNTRYKKFAIERGARFLPFIVETHGALGKQTGGVYKILAKKAAVSNSADLSVTDFIKQFNQSLSVTLQRGNALVARMGAVNSRSYAADAERAAGLR